MKKIFLFAILFSGLALADSNNWMGDLLGTIGDRPLNQVTLPGAHDALTQGIIQDSHGPDLPFCEGEMKDENGEDTTPFKAYLAAQALGQTELYANLARAQRNNVSEDDPSDANRRSLLSLGVRYFDFRACNRFGKQNFENFTAPLKSLHQMLITSMNESDRDAKWRDTLVQAKAKAEARIKVYKRYVSVIEAQDIPKHQKQLEQEEEALNELWSQKDSSISQIETLKKDLKYLGYIKQREEFPGELVTFGGGRIVYKAYSPDKTPPPLEEALPAYQESIEAMRAKVSEKNRSLEDLDLLRIQLEEAENAAHDIDAQIASAPERIEAAQLRVQKSLTLKQMKQSALEESEQSLSATNVELAKLENSNAGLSLDDMKREQERLENAYFSQYVPTHGVLNLKTTLHKEFSGVHQFLKDHPQEIVVIKLKLLGFSQDEAREFLHYHLSGMEDMIASPELTPASTINEFLENGKRLIIILDFKGDKQFDRYWNRTDHIRSYWTEKPNREQLVDALKPEMSLDGADLITDDIDLNAKTRLLPKGLGGLRLARERNALHSMQFMVTAQQDVGGLLFGFTSNNQPIDMAQSVVSSGSDRTLIHAAAPVNKWLWEMAGMVLNANDGKIHDPVTKRKLVQELNLSQSNAIIIDDAGWYRLQKDRPSYLAERIYMLNLADR